MDTFFMNWNNLHKKYKENSLFGRYITLPSVLPFLEKNKKKFEVVSLGNSVLNEPVFQLKIGKGKFKIFMWSQMHGNESTTTKAVFDLINFLNSDDKIAVKIIQNCTVIILPMVNPDGAKLYTRFNANLIDLNRDSIELSQPESKILREAFLNFQPDLCFNLHDQRTIFGVDKTGSSATVSFLAPSFNEERDYNTNRLKAVSLINKMNLVLQKEIPNGVARFDDRFNPNCIGDSFQMQNVPTILFEAGHFQEDYNREITRKLIFISLVEAISKSYENVIVNNDLDNYLKIPQNNTNFYDFICKNIRINYDSNDLITNFAFQYKEVLLENKIEFIAHLVAFGDLNESYGHSVIDCDGAIFENCNSKFPEIGEVADFMLNKKKVFQNGKKIN
ncbi:MAG: hypothetical protein ACI9XR_002186 [Flavobacterium sp.]|jgi:hypothetical protein